MEDYHHIIDYCCLKTKISEIPYKGILKGEIGRLLLCASIYTIDNNKLYWKKCNKILQNLFKVQYGNFSFGYGLAGNMWLLDYLMYLDLFEIPENLVKESNHILFKKYSDFLFKNDIDYFRGAGGILNYFIHKKVLVPEIYKIANEYVKIVKYQLKFSICGKGYLKYGDYDKKEIINLGVPHGVTGIILLLLIIKEKLGIDVSDIVKDLFYYILKYSIKDNGYNIPCFIGDQNLSKLAWCYGNLPILYAFMKYSVLYKDETYVLVVNKLTEDVLLNTDCYPDNISLCHGSTVVAYFFYKFFTLTKNRQFFEKAIYWKAYVCSKMKENFNKHKSNESYNDFFNNPSLFLGFPGLFIVLLTLDNEIESKWDSCLLF